jgi:hypothetical protein
LGKANCRGRRGVWLGLLSVGRRGNELGSLEGLKERPWPQQALLLAPRFKGSLAQVAAPVAVEAGVVEA